MYDTNAILQRCYPGGPIGFQIINDAELKLMRTHAHEAISISLLPLTVEGNSYCGISRASGKRT